MLACERRLEERFGRLFGFRIMIVLEKSRVEATFSSCGIQAFRSFNRGKMAHQAASLLRCDRL